MTPISLLIKPASGNCNLGCEYCFYSDVITHREVESYGFMTLETLEKLVAKTIQNATGTCSFVFQGGEPTLVGLEFYQSLIVYQKKYEKPNLTIHNAIQTNGMLIDEKWAKFFRKHHFLVGLSLDGPKAIHDSLRKDRKQQGTFDRVIETAHLFEQYGVEFNVLTVISEEVARNIEDIYSFFKQQNFKHLQFIPCLDPLFEEYGKYSHSLTWDSYQYFLITLFDRWYQDIQIGNTISIRYFDNLLKMLCGQYPEACGMLGRCGNHYIIEADGGVYPCDFYALDEYKIGNLLTDSFETIEENRLKNKFTLPITYKSSKCQKCRWFNICYGGCRRDREPVQGDKAGHNHFCNAYKAFFKHAMPELQKIVYAIQTKRLQ